MFQRGTRCQLADHVWLRVNRGLYRLTNRCWSMHPNKWPAENNWRTSTSAWGREQLIGRRRTCGLVINSNFGPVLHRFWAQIRRLIGWKSRIFLTRSHLTPSLRVNLFEFLDELLIAKIRVPRAMVLGLSFGEDFVILACVFLTQCQRVTDRHGRTDSQPDRKSIIFYLFIVAF